MASLKPKRPSLWKRQQISQSSDSSILRPTCSSAIKGKKIPDQLEIPQEGHLSERNLAKKFCPYSYCSLHGHHRHGEAPTLKRLKSARKRANAQRSKKLEGQPPQDGGEVNSDSLGLVDVQSVEIMSPRESSGESIQQACLHSEEQDVLVPPLALNGETYMELRQSGSELELGITDSNNTQKNKEEISSVSCDTGGGNVALDEDQAASPVVRQLKPEDGGGFSHDLSSKSTAITET